LTSGGHGGDPLMLSSTALSVERTRIAYQRTIMASLRTSTSLITFGFAIYKFFQIDLLGAAEPRHVIGPREFGMAMIVIALLSLSVGWLEYRRDTGRLRAAYPELPRSLAGVTAGFVAALGTLALIIVYLRR
jgi:putative membrane protein